MGGCNLNIVDIEKNIAPPPIRPWTALVRHMKIGDSILVKTRSQADAIRKSAWRLQIDITSKKVYNGIRIWRAGRNRTKSGVFENGITYCEDSLDEDI